MTQTINQKKYMEIAFSLLEVKFLADNEKAIPVF